MIELTRIVKKDKNPNNPDNSSGNLESTRENVPKKQERKSLTIRS